MVKNRKKTALKKIIDFKRQYSLSFKFLKESKQALWTVSILFILSAMFGYFFPWVFEDFVKRIIIELSRITEGMNFAQMEFFILQNNLKSSFFAVVFGVFFGLLPAVSTFFNGYMIGYVASRVIPMEGISSMLLLFPHGIFELPAIIISLAMGLRLGSVFFSKDKNREFWGRLENSFRVFLYIVMPLLIVASVIETALIFLM